MIIGTRQRLNNLSQDINVSIDGKVLKEVETKKTLGVLVDEHLCFKGHWHVAPCKALCSNQNFSTSLPNPSSTTL